MVKGSGFVEPLDVLQHGDYCLFTIEQIPQFIRLDVEQWGGCCQEADEDSNPGDDHDDHDDDDDTEHSTGAGLTMVGSGLMEAECSPECTRATITACIAWVGPLKLYLDTRPRLGHITANDEKNHDYVDYWSLNIRYNNINNYFLDKSRCMKLHWSPQSPQTKIIHSAVQGHGLHIQTKISRIWASKMCFSVLTISSKG